VRNDVGGRLLSFEHLSRLGVTLGGRKWTKWTQWRQDSFSVMFQEHNPNCRVFLIRNNGEST